MIPITHGVILSVVLFMLGFNGILICRNFLYKFLCLEIMLNASSLLFIFSGNYYHQVDGQIMYILIITLAAAEAAIYLTLLLHIQKFYHTLDIDVF